MKSLLSNLFSISLLDERVMPKETIYVIVIFGSLVLITIALSIVLLFKNRKAAKEAEIINKKKELDDED